MQLFQADVALQIIVICFNEAVTRRKKWYAGSKKPDGEIAMTLSELIEKSIPMHRELILESLKKILSISSFVKW